MKFYKDKNGNNALVVFDENGMFLSEGWQCYEAVAALYDEPGSPVCGTSVSLHYLEQCEEITEDEALEMNPDMETYLVEAEA